MMFRELCVELIDYCFPTKWQSCVYQMVFCEPTHVTMDIRAQPIREKNVFFFPMDLSQKCLKAREVFRKSSEVFTT